MQSFQLIRGFYDTDIQEKIVADAAHKNLILQDIIKTAEAIESGEQNSGVLSLSAVVNIISSKIIDSNKYCEGFWYSGSQ